MLPSGGQVVLDDNPRAGCRVQGRRQTVNLQPGMTFQLWWGYINPKGSMLPAQLLRFTLYLGLSTNMYALEHSIDNRLGKFQSLPHTKPHNYSLKPKYLIIPKSPPIHFEAPNP